jgi:hypothetical protein
VNRTILGALCAAAGLTWSMPAAAQGGCERELLTEISQSWIRAVEAGRMTEMKLGEWVDYNENFTRSSLGAFLDRPRKVDWHLALLDTTTCRAYVEAVILDEERPMVIATQMGNGFFGVGPFNNIVTDEGDWLFDAQATYEYARREDWSELPEGERPTREQLIAAADAYLDLFMDKSVEVPWGEPCARLEGGIYTARGEPTDSCNVGVPENIPMVDREYVVDEAKGAVNVFLKMGENQRPDSHTFRLIDGKIRYIHTVTNCGEQANCGFPPLAETLAERPELQPDPAMFD